MEHDIHLGRILVFTSWKVINCIIMSHLLLVLLTLAHHHNGLFGLQQYLSYMYNPGISLIGGERMGIRRKHVQLTYKLYHNLAGVKFTALLMANKIVDDDITRI